MSFLRCSKFTLECEDEALSSVVQAIHYINNPSLPLCDVAFPQVITLDKLESHCLKDHDYIALHKLVENGFPSKRDDTPPTLKTYWTLAKDGELSTFNNIVLRHQAIVIHKSLRSQVLQILHSAHQGCSGMLARARSSVFWPGYSKDINKYRLNCKSCTEHAPSQAREPLIITSPPRPQRDLLRRYVQTFANLVPTTTSSSQIDLAASSISSILLLHQLPHSCKPSSGTSSHVMAVQTK